MSDRKQILLTSDAFSIKFLREHPLTKPIIEKYYGIHGLKHYDKPNHRIRRDVFNRDGKVATMAELDEIPVRKILARRFWDDFEINCDSLPYEYEEFKILFNAYLDSRPYGEMVQEDERHFIAPLMWFYLRDYYDIYEHVSPTNWQDAMIYLRYKNKRMFNLSEEKISVGKRALQRYQAIYAFKKMQEETAKEFLNDFFDIDSFFERSSKFFDLLSEVMSEDIAEKFVHQDVPRVIDLEELDAILGDIPEENEKYALCPLYRYPEWIEFTPEASSKIISLILEDKLSDESIDYFLGTSGDSANDYVELYPAIKRVIQTTQDAHTLYTAGDVLNVIWLTIDNETTSEWIRKEIYDMYWPRIGSVWPIKHYDHLELDINQRRIFKDSVGWLASLDDIAKLNPELGDYLNSNFRLNFEPLKKRRLEMKYGGDGFEQFYDTLLAKDVSQEDILRYFCYPINKVEVDFVIKKLVEEYSKHQSKSVIGALEYLLLHIERCRDAGSYLLKNLLDNRWFWQLGSKYLIYMFTAACEGVHNQDELEPLRLLAKKTLKYYKNSEQQSSFNLNDIQETIDFALKMVEQRLPRLIKAHKRVTSDLRRHAEEIAKVVTLPDLTDICCFKLRLESKNRI